ncbi:hypothetical protein HF086_011216 [Spodoptera exigua]|uniref:Major facilitator superfamily (MFS) profile domain-containing protein n=1 Tax=Spodoptera exigua TaxID=7107 RepID=A0A922MTS8_SPOEX|nr:hypothetical protein HF086_011216 [Spodoptera exigua]
MDAESNTKSDTKDLKMEKMPKVRQEETDKLVKAIGQFGKWQLMLWLLIASPIKISAAWQQLGIVFIAPATSFMCEQTNLTNTIEMNTCYSDCVSYKYYTDFKNTIISQFEADLRQSLVVELYADYLYGRRPALLISCMLLLVTSIGEAFCKIYWLFTAVRFFIGLATAGTMLCSFILMMEIIGPMKRELMNCLCALPMPVGQMLMPLFAYFLRSWDNFCLGVGIPHVLYLAYFFILPESPKWLISVGRLEEASKVMTQAAKWNNLPTDNMLDVAKSIASEKVNSNEPIRKATYLDLLKTKVLRINIFGSCMIWFVLGISYYGSNQYIGQTSSNVFISVLLAGVLQIPGILLSGFLCRYFGRKITMISFLIVCGGSNAFLVVPEDWFAVRLTMGAIGVGCASGAFATMYMYTTEMFPTVARNMAMGASSTVSRVGSMIAPYVAGMTIIAAWLPPVAFAIVPIVGAITCYFLPETRGKTLSDHLS